MSAVTADWLTRHGCSLEKGAGGNAYLVMFDKEPQYLLKAVPLGSKLGCNVIQTINGKRLDAGGTYPTLDDALRGGLEDLRKALGW